MSGFPYQFYYCLWHFCEVYGCWFHTKTTSGRCCCNMFNATKSCWCCIGIWLLVQSRWCLGNQDIQTVSQEYIFVALNCGQFMAHASHEIYPTTCWICRHEAGCLMAAHPRRYEMQPSARVIVPLTMILTPTHSKDDVHYSRDSLGLMIDLNCWICGLWLGLIVVWEKQANHWTCYLLYTTLGVKVSDNCCCNMLHDWLGQSVSHEKSGELVLLAVLLETTVFALLLSDVQLKETWWQISMMRHWSGWRVARTLVGACWQDCEVCIIVWYEKHVSLTSWGWVGYCEPIKDFNNSLLEHLLCNFVWQYAHSLLPSNHDNIKWQHWGDTASSRPMDVIVPTSHPLWSWKGLFMFPIAICCVNFCSSCLQWQCTVALKKVPPVPPSYLMCIPLFMLPPVTVQCCL